MPPVVVFSVQKTASTAVAEALRAIEGQAVFHFHYLDENYKHTIGAAMRWPEITQPGQNDAGLRAFGVAFTSALMREHRRLKVISLVRDPIARNISSYFENLDRLWNVEQAHDHFDVGRLLAEFHSRFDHDEGANWFDREFKTVLGMDIYEYPFPRDAGFLRIDSGPYEVLIMRHDLNDRLKEKCVAELIGCPAISIVPRNVGAQKSYAHLYQEFLGRLELTEKYVDHQLGSKYARHFFGPDEIARLRARWIHGRAKTKLI